jgi:hypothetical protein
VISHAHQLLLLPLKTRQQQTRSSNSAAPKNLVYLDVVLYTCPTVEEGQVVMICGSVTDQGSITKMPQSSCGTHSSSGSQEIIAGQYNSAPVCPSLP